MPYRAGPALVRQKAEVTFDEVTVPPARGLRGLGHWQPLAGRDQARQKRTSIARPASEYIHLVGVKPKPTICYAASQQLAGCIASRFGHFFARPALPSREIGALTMREPRVTQSLQFS